MWASTVATVASPPQLPTGGPKWTAYHACPDAADAPGRPPSSPPWPSPFPSAGAGQASAADVNNAKNAGFESGLSGWTCSANSGSVVSSPCTPVPPR